MNASDLDALAWEPIVDAALSPQHALALADAGRVAS